MNGVVACRSNRRIDHKQDRLAVGEQGRIGNILTAAEGIVGRIARFDDVNQLVENDANVVCNRVTKSSNDIWTTGIGNHVGRSRGAGKDVPGNRYFHRVTAAVAELSARNEEPSGVGQRNIDAVLLPLVTNNIPSRRRGAYAERNWMILLNVTRIDWLLDDADCSRNHVAIIDGREVGGGGRFGIGRNTWITLLPPGHREAVAPDAFFEKGFHIVLLSTRERNACGGVLAAGEIAVVFAAGHILLGNDDPSSRVCAGRIERKLREVIAADIEAIHAIARRNEIGRQPRAVIITATAAEALIEGEDVRVEDKVRRVVDELRLQHQVGHRGARRWKRGVASEQLDFHRSRTHDPT